MKLKSLNDVYFYETESYGCNGRASTQFVFSGMLNSSKLKTEQLGEVRAFFLPLERKNQVISIEVSDFALEQAIQSTIAHLKSVFNSPKNDEAFQLTEEEVLSIKFLLNHFNMTRQQLAYFLKN